MRLVLDWLDSNILWLLLSAGSIFGYFWLLEWKRKLNISGRAALGLSVLNSVLGVLFVKLFAFMEGVPGGMSLFGGVFFLPITYYFGAKITGRKTEDVCDIFAICTIFTVMCARTNCLLSGCCGGIEIPGTDGLRWPTQMIEIIFYLILIFILGKKVGKKKYEGKIYPLYLITYGIFRFILEFVREKEIQTLFHLSHFWAVIAVAAGWLFYRRQMSRKNAGHVCNLKMRNNKGG